MRFYKLSLVEGKGNNFPTDSSLVILAKVPVLLLGREKCIFDYLFLEESIIYIIAIY